MSFVYNAKNMTVNDYSLNDYYKAYPITNVDNSTTFLKGFKNDLVQEQNMIKPTLVIKYLVKDEGDDAKKLELMKGLGRTFAIAKLGLKEYDQKEIIDLGKSIQECKKNEAGRWFALGTPFNIISKISSAISTIFLILGAVWGAVTLASIVFPVPVPLIVSGVLSLSLCLPAAVFFRLVSMLTGYIGDQLLNWNVDSKLQKQGQQESTLKNTEVNKNAEILNDLKVFDHDALVAKRVLESIQERLSDDKLQVTKEKDLESYKEYVSKLQSNLDDQISRRKLIRQSYIIKA